jgi:predicted nuclease of restriction endonuclease-like RecB superfamily
VLTADLVRVRTTRDGWIRPLRPHPRLEPRYLRIAADYEALLGQATGQSRAQVKQALDAVSVATHEQHVANGLRKLLLDRCEFQSPGEVDPPLLRADLFTYAARVRHDLEPGERFARGAVLAEVAARHGISPQALEEGLYADLKEAQRLLSFEPLGAPNLLRHYHRALEQAILLRASRVVIEAGFHTPGLARLFFRKLKFRRLLFRLEPLPGGAYRITVDGPVSLFHASTRYGLQLALILPALWESAEFSLLAEVLWGRERRELRFGLEHRLKQEGGGEIDPARSCAGSGDATAAGAAPQSSPAGQSVRLPLPDEVQQLLTAFRRLDTPWRVRGATKLLHLPGIGLCIPDLRFSHPDQPPVYLEVMGFWSRDAVWRRVELAQAGLKERVIFAVSERLRVSEAALGAEERAALYVYKGSMSARAVLRMLEQLTGAAQE